MVSVDWGVVRADGLGRRNFGLAEVLEDGGGNWSGEEEGDRIQARGWLVPAQGEKEGTSADEDEESADETHHSFGREDFAKFCGKGSRDDSTENEACDQG